MRSHEMRVDGTASPPWDREYHGIRTVEGLARVVLVEGRVAWLVPEQSVGCGGCALASACAGEASPRSSRRDLARRFPLYDVTGLVVGDRVVVGVAEGSLVMSALTAYALPLVVGFGAVGIADSVFGSDPASIIAMLAGLAIGLLVAKWAARRLRARGHFSPRLLRRAGPGQACGID